jgi:hypothetical protein
MATTATVGLSSAVTALISSTCCGGRSLLAVSEAFSFGALVRPGRSAADGEDDAVRIAGDISPPVAPGVHHLQRGQVGVGREADFHIVGVWPNDRDLLNFTAERCRPFSFLSKVTDSAASRSRPLYPQKRTFVSAAGTSARCQRQTSFQTGITELVRRAHTRPTCAILNCFQRGGSMRGSCPLICGRHSALGDVCHGSAIPTSHRAVT